MHTDVTQILKSRLNVPNRLLLIVKEFSISQLRAPFLQVEYYLLDNKENNRQIGFPELSMDDLYYLSLGPYQIRNATSYYTKHQKEGLFLVQKFNPNRRYPPAAVNYENYGNVVEQPNLIKAYMKSRYRGGKNHYIFVLIDKAKTSRDAICEYYCTCESGARTAGCCSHVM